MKKYIGVYVILCAILLILFVTHGIPYGTIVREDDFASMRAGKTTYILLAYNIIISLVVLVVGIVISCKKDNKLRFKWLFPIGMLVFILALVPILKIVSIGGFHAAKDIEFYYSLLTSYSR